MAAGRAVLLETTGRVTGRRRIVAVGFLEEADGALLVAAGPDVHWARNLVTEPRCRVGRDGTFLEHRADPLDGPARDAAIVALILRYGTPAERLGRGPVFRLRPLPAVPHDPG